MNLRNNNLVEGEGRKLCEFIYLQYEKVKPFADADY